MSWIGLEYPEPGRVIKVTWGQKVYQALNILYEMRGPFKGGYLTGDITPDVDLAYKVGDIHARIKEVHAGYGYFSYDLFVQGKKVIKDGDPVNINDLFEPARTKITQAIDYSTYVRKLDAIDAKLAEVLQKFDIKISDVKSSIDYNYSYLGSILDEIDKKLIDVLQEIRVPSRVLSIDGYAYETPSKLYDISIFVERVIIKVAKDAPYGLLIGDETDQKFLLEPGEKQEIRVRDPSKVFVRSVAGAVKFYALFEVK